MNLVSLSSPFPTVLNIGSQTPVLDLWHRRLADTSHRVIREAVRNRLIEGIVLDRKYFNLKSSKQYRCSCDICARAKMHRVSFPAVRDRLVGLLPGSYVFADVLIMQNIPSREGYCYVLFLIDHASKISFVLPLTRRDSGSILAHIKVWLNETLPLCGITLRHFHSDGDDG